MKLHARIGATLSINHLASYGGMLECADIAMCEAKEMGAIRSASAIWLRGRQNRMGGRIIQRYPRAMPGDLKGLAFAVAVLIAGAVCR
jgi:hypothetical protein